jgi:hypothetical protein
MEKEERKKKKMDGTECYLRAVGNSGPRYLARTYEVAITRARGRRNLSTRSHC